MGSKADPGMEAGIRSTGCCSLLSPMLDFPGASLGAQTAKNPPAIQETRVRSLAQEDPLEKGMASHSSIPAWRIPWTEEPGGLWSMQSQSQAQLSDYHFHFQAGYPAADTLRLSARVAEQRLGHTRLCRGPAPQAFNRALLVSELFLSCKMGSGGAVKGTMLIPMEGGGASMK